MNKTLTTESVNEVLHKYWDPIGCGVPDDEYVDYATVVVSLLNHNCGWKVISSYLLRVETHMMGINVKRNSIRVAFNKFKEYGWVDDE